MKTLDLFDLELAWEMSNAEKVCLYSLLKDLQPAISVEIGTRNGGSLQLISPLSELVYSLDIDESVSRLQNQFKNVQFLIGDSRQTLPTLINQLAVHHEQPDFVLVDGDHSAEGVRADIQSILSIKVTRRLLILIHDSFNPSCRKGILSIDYANNPYVESIELDFIQGIFSPGETTRREMWGGFALIVLSPAPNRKTPLTRQSSHYPYKSTLPFSTHFHSSEATLRSRLQSYVLRKMFR